jgi:DNA-binding NarL/FixJ family response regulator
LVEGRRVVSRAGSHRAAGTSPIEEAGRLRVAIADDHPAYRGRLAIFLRDRGLDVVGEVGNGQAAIELSETVEPDVILMDLRMPILSGFEAIRRLGTVVPRRRILAISAAALEDEIADAILLGASGHVSKDRPLVELTWALGAIAAGKRLIAPGTAQVLLRRIQGDADPQRSLADASMVRRELDLLGCLAQSYTTPQIGIALNATPDEVDEDIEMLLTKLRVEKRIQDASLEESGDRG